MASIQLKTPVPGPKSQAMLARRASAVPNGLGKATDVVVERAEGALVHDVDGNTFLDFVGGIGVRVERERGGGAADRQAGSLVGQIVRGRAAGIVLSGKIDREGRGDSGI